MVCGDLVHVAGLTDVALGVVERAVAFVAFGVCAVPEFGAVEGVRVDVVQQGFEAAHVLAGCEVAAADCVVPFVVYEASRVAAEGEGDGHVVVVADVFGEVGLLLVGERVPRVGERGHDGEIGGAGGEEVGGFGDLVDLGGVHGWVSFSLVVGVFSCVGFSVAHVWACALAQSRKRWGRALWGVSREERPVVWGGGACWLPVWACVACVFLALRAAIGVVWVRACSSPPFFCLSRVSGVFSGERGGALGFGLSCFCVRSVVDYGCEVACEW